MAERGARRVCPPLKLAPYTSRHPAPSTLPPWPLQVIPQPEPAPAQQAVLQNDSPICTIRPFSIRYRFIASAGVPLLAQIRFWLPRLHVLLLIAYARIGPTTP